MKLETFFEKFDLFADAPDAVAKMRELILESALRGNLVSQDASDEPASSLVGRLEAQSGPQGRKQRALPPVGDDAYLQTPDGWAWTRLGNTGRIFNGDSVSEAGKAELAKVEEGLPFIATKDVGYGRDPLAYGNGLKVPIGDCRFKVAKATAVLICAEGGSAGKKIGLCDRDICFGNKLYANEVREDLDHRFIFYVYQAPTFFKEFAARMTGIIGGIARSEFLSLPIPIPPLAEQKRIVAKVDELMALCDRLKAQQQERETRHAALARASLARFAEAPTPANLDFLFHKSYSIPPADLRKSIITLAVQGKLVSQDPNDESALALNSKLPDQLRALAERVGARYVTPDACIAGSDELPAGWGLAAIQSIGITQTGTTPSKSDSSFAGRDIPFIKPGDIQGDAVDYENEGLSPSGLAAGRLIPKNSVLMVSIGGSIGKTALVDRDVSCNQQINSVSPAECIEPRFVLTAIRSADFQTEVMNRAAQGTLPIISKSKWETIQIPIPPLAEQRRIVAKVDCLMALVDALEAQLASSHKAGSQLLEAVVAELTRGRALA